MNWVGEPTRIVSCPCCATPTFGHYKSRNFSAAKLCLSCVLHAEDQYAYDARRGGGR